MLLRKGIFFALTLKGELEDVQETPAPESPPGGVSTADLSLTLPDGDRSDAGSSALPTTSDSAPPCEASFKEDAGENTALLGESFAGSQTKWCYQWLKEGEEIHKVQKSVKEEW